MGFKPQILQFGMILRWELIRFKDTIQLLIILSMEADKRLSFEDTFITPQIFTIRYRPYKFCLEINSAFWVEKHLSGRLPHLSTSKVLIIIKAVC